MKKFLLVSWGIFFAIILLLYGYFFYWSDTTLPQSLMGTESDPSTFMSQKELLLSEKYSTIKDFLYFVSIAWSTIILLTIIAGGWSYKWEIFSNNAVKSSFLRLTSYYFIFSLISTIIELPIDYISYKTSVSYGISIQDVQSWLRDNIIDFWISFAIGLLIVQVLYFLIQKSPRKWWLHAFSLSIPFILFFTFIQPVIIDPIYNDFSRLENKELEKKIVALAKEANIPAEKVYQVNMSDKTNALNAYVTGIGTNSRIVLWDTTLKQLTEDQILFIMAHEIGHYVKKHVYVGIATYLLFTLIGLYICHKLIRIIVKKHGSKMGIINNRGFTIIPLFFLLSSTLSFFSDPVSNYQSRLHEVACDTYALETTENKAAAIKTFQELSRLSLDDVNPPMLVKIFRGSHPSILERIEYIKKNEVR